MNAKQEFLRDLKVYNKNIEDVSFIAIKYHGKIITNIDELDFDYDNGYGSQNLFGFVLLNDGVWFERYEYDGSECWEYKKTPTIEELQEYIKNY
jgi:hypothetical protein